MKSAKIDNKQFGKHIKINQKDISGLQHWELEMFTKIIPSVSCDYIFYYKNDVGAHCIN